MTSSYAAADLWHYVRNQLSLGFPASPGYAPLLVLTNCNLNSEDYGGYRQAGHRDASTRFVPQLAREDEQ